MSTKGTKPDTNAQIPPCFREDGSFDFVAFLLAPPVLVGLIFIFIGLGVCLLVTYVFPISSDMVNILILMLCSFTCFSGADNIIKYLNAQRKERGK